MRNHPAARSVFWFRHIVLLRRRTGGQSISTTDCHIHIVGHQAALDPRYSNVPTQTLKHSLRLTLCPTPLRKLPQSRFHHADNHVGHSSGSLTPSTPVESKVRLRYVRVTVPLRPSYRKAQASSLPPRHPGLHPKNISSDKTLQPSHVSGA